MSRSLTVLAPAKVNLSLQITGRRDDGFHELDSIIGFTDVCDCITVTACEDLDLSVNGTEADHVGPDPDNLVLRAASFVQAQSRTSEGARIELEKHIPVAAGLGGGSADAAATVKACLQWWQMTNRHPIDDKDLAHHLGADVPVCRFGRAARVTGIGEVISPLPLWPETWLLLVNPRVPLATADVFSAFSGPVTGSEVKASVDLDWGASAEDFAETLKPLGNALTDAASRLAPVIKDVLELLTSQPACLLACMSGSGPTCFGMFASSEKAQSAADNIARDRPEWWIRVTPLLAKTGENPL